MAANPTAKAIYLCEEIDVEGGLANIYGLFNAIGPASYPHTQESFICFAQLLGGLDEVSFRFDITRAEDNHMVHRTDLRTLWFPDRTILVQLAVSITGCVFERPGVYLVELYCDNTWVADTTIRLLEVSS